MLDHPLARELSALLDLIYDEASGTQIRNRIDRASQLVADLDEIIRNLNLIAKEAFNTETQHCEHCESDHHKDDADVQ